MPVERFEISARFCGPPRSGNGGYVCGRLARHVPGTASVRLKAPPPLLAPLTVEGGDAAARLLHAGQLIAEARPAQLDLALPPAVDLAQAERSTRSFLGHRQHPFPSCFVCGTQRRPGDGLRIFPGSVDGGTTLAAPWTPDSSLAGADGRLEPEFLWAALDCTGGFAMLPAPAGRAMVLGELTVAIDAELLAGTRCFAVGWPLGSDGRKRFAGSAIYTEDGRLLARARAVWIEVPAGEWN